MVDGVKIFAKLKDFIAFKDKTGIQFSVPANVATGELIGRRHKSNRNNYTYTHKGKFEHYRLTVLETHNHKNSNNSVSYNLFIEGSLHKNYFGGKNYQRFNFHLLQNEINHLCDRLDLDPHQCIIQNLEIGVNVNTPFDPKSFISNNLLLHSTVPFEDYLPGENRLIIGRFARHAQHSVKCYNKGLQYGLRYPLLRFEERCIKMQYLSKYKIRTLADLSDYEKVKAISQIVINAWDKVLVCDTGIAPKDLNLPQKDRELLIGGCYRDYWVRLHKNNRQLFSKQRTRFKRLTSVYGKATMHSLIRKLIVDELALLLETGTFLPCAEYLHENAGWNILTNLVNCKIVPVSSDAISIESPQGVSSPETGSQESLTPCMPGYRPHDTELPTSTTPSATKLCTPRNIQPSDLSTNMEPSDPKDEVTGLEPMPEYQTTGEYDRKQAEKHESQEATILVGTYARNQSNWLIKRFLNKV